MKKMMQSFRRHEDGAVTVDWVVLTAAVVALGLGVIVIIESGSEGTIVQMWANVDSQVANAAQ